MSLDEMSCELISFHIRELNLAAESLRSLSRCGLTEVQAAVVGIAISQIDRTRSLLMEIRSNALESGGAA